MKGIKSSIMGAALLSLPGPTHAQSSCEIADILFGPIRLDVLELKGTKDFPSYETAIVRSGTFDNQKKPYGAILGEITVDRGGFAVRSTDQVVVGLVSPDLILEGFDDACNRRAKIKMVAVADDSYVTLSDGEPVGTVHGRFPKNDFGAGNN